MKPLTEQQTRVLRAQKAGLTQYATAKMIGISRQRVSAIVRRLRQLGELPVEEKAS